MVLALTMPIMAAFYSVLLLFSFFSSRKSGSDVGRGESSDSGRGRCPRKMGANSMKTENEVHQSAASLFPSKSACAESKKRKWRAETSLFEKKEGNGEGGGG